MAFMDFFRAKPNTPKQTSEMETKAQPIPRRNNWGWYNWRADPWYVERDYLNIARNFYLSNPVVHRSIKEIANAFSSVTLVIRNTDDTMIYEHPLLTLLNQPTPGISGNQFRFNLAAYYLLAGSAYIKTIGTRNRPQQLHLLRPDFVKLDQSQEQWVYKYQLPNEQPRETWLVDMATGLVQDGTLYHIRDFNPLDEWRGSSPAEAAAYAGDNFNLVNQWNKRILQNSGAMSLVLKFEDKLSDAEFDEQVDRLKSATEMINKGIPAVLDGSADLEDMSRSPKEMDWVDGKDSMARDIARAFGIPPQLLGIRGDNTYQNYKEARAAFYEQTVEPLIRLLVSNLDAFLSARYGVSGQLDVDWDAITAMYPKREMKYDMLNKADFLTLNEKRIEAGFPPLPDSDSRGNLTGYELKRGV